MYHLVCGNVYQTQRTINDNTLKKKDATSKTSVDETAKAVFNLLLKCSDSGEYLKHRVNGLELLNLFFDYSGNWVGAP